MATRRTKNSWMEQYGCRTVRHRSGRSIKSQFQAFQPHSKLRVFQFTIEEKGLKNSKFSSTAIENMSFKKIIICANLVLAQEASNSLNLGVPPQVSYNCKVPCHWQLLHGLDIISVIYIYSFRRIVTATRSFVMGKFVAHGNVAWSASPVTNKKYALVGVKTRACQVDRANVAA